MIPVVLVLSALWLLASLVLTAWVSHGASKKREKRKAE